MTKSGLRRKKRSKIVLDELSKILIKSKYLKNVCAIHLCELRSNEKGDLIGLEHLTKTGLSIKKQLIRFRKISLQQKKRP